MGSKHQKAKWALQMLLKNKRFFHWTQFWKSFEEFGHPTLYFDLTLETQTGAIWDLHASQFLRETSMILSKISIPCDKIVLSTTLFLPQMLFGNIVPDENPQYTSITYGLDHERFHCYDTPYIISDSPSADASFSQMGKTFWKRSTLGERTMANRKLQTDIEKKGYRLDFIVETWCCLDNISLIKWDFIFFLGQKMRFYLVTIYKK